MGNMEAGREASLERERGPIWNAVKNVFDGGLADCQKASAGHLNEKGFPVPTDGFVGFMGCASAKYGGKPGDCPEFKCFCTFFVAGVYAGLFDQVATSTYVP